MARKFLTDIDLDSNDLQNGGNISGGGGGSSSIRVFDTLTDTNGTLITAHTPDLNETNSGIIEVTRGGIALTPGSTDIQSNEASLNLGSHGFGIDTGVTEGVVSVEFTADTSAAWIEILARWQDNDNYVAIQLRPSNGDLTVQQRVGGVDTFPTATTFSWSNGAAYTASIEVKGGLVTANVRRNDSGTSRITTTYQLTDSNALSGTVFGVVRAGGPAGTPTINTFAIGATGGGGGGDTTGSPTSGARVNLTGNQTIPNNITTILNFDNEIFDTESYHDNVTNNSRLTIPEDGFYVLTGTIDWDQNATGERQLQFFKNSSSIDLVERDTAVAGFRHRQNGATITQAIAGDYFELGVFQNSGAPLDANSTFTEFKIVKIPGTGTNIGQAVTGARVNRNAVQSIPTGVTTDLIFNQQIYDTEGYHDLVTNPERLTIPEDGFYVIDALARWADNTTGDRAVQIVLNGVNSLAISRDEAGNGATRRLHVSTSYLLNAGDYVTCAVFQNSGGNLDVQTASTFFSIVKVPDGGGANGRETLRAPRTYYVATTGNDSNTGLAVGDPFLTIQRAIDVAAELDAGPHNITIQLADGTYTLTSNLIPKQPNGTGRVAILGNSGDQTLVVVSGGGTVGSGGLFDYIGQVNNRKYRIQYLTVENFANDLCAISGDQNSFQIDDCDFNAPMGAGRRVIYAVGDEIFITIGGTINIDMTGATPRNFINTLGINSHAQCQGATFTVAGSPVFSGAYIAIERVSRCNLTDTTATGSFTGTGISAAQESVVLTSGSTSIPNGTSTATGGVIL